MLKNYYMRWALSRMGSSYREKRDVEQVDFGCEELSHRCNDLVRKKCAKPGKMPKRWSPVPFGLPFKDLEDISDFSKEGGDIHFQVGEMSKDIVGIVCLKRMSCPQRSFQKVLS
jgi:hypothetical protein